MQIAEKQLCYEPTCGYEHKLRIMQYVLQILETAEVFENNEWKIH